MSWKLITLGEFLLIPVHIWNESFTEMFFQNISENPENLSDWDKLSKIVIQTTVIPVY